MAKSPEKTSRSERKPDEDGVDVELATEITRRITNLVPQGQRNQVVAQVLSVVTAERFAGPIAHPKHLREYEEICPGAADRIILMAEGQLEHAQSIQNSMLAAEVADGLAGRRYGFAALIAIIVCAMICVLTGHDGMAAAFLSAGVFGVIGQFIQGRLEQANAKRDEERSNG